MSEDMKPIYVPICVNIYHELTNKPKPGGVNYQRIGVMVEKMSQGQTRNQVRQWLKDILDQQEPDVPADVTNGNWRSDFLVGQNNPNHVEHGLYFAPSCVTWPAQRRRELFEWLRANNHTHVHLNAVQNNWGPSKGDWRYTEGAPFSVHGKPANMRRYLDVVAEARSYGFIVTAGMFEQNNVVDIPLSQLIDYGNRFVDEVWQDIPLFQWSWEYDYVLPVSASRRAHEDRFLSEIDWHGRDIGLHYRPALAELPPNTNFDNYPHDPGLSGGITRYAEMEARLNNGGHVTRLMQWARTASETTVRLQTQKAMTVHGHGTDPDGQAQHRLGSFCAFEFSGGMRISGHTPRHGETIRGWIMDEVRKAKMPADRNGYMN